jgi:hypothetical protein
MNRVREKGEEEWKVGQRGERDGVWRNNKGKEGRWKEDGGRKRGIFPKGVSAKRGYPKKVNPFSRWGDILMYVLTYVHKYIWKEPPFVMRGHHPRGHHRRCPRKKGKEE